MAISDDTLWETSKIAGDDLVKILELDIQKYSISFEEPKFVRLHFESPTQSQNFDLELPQKWVTILIYRPDAEKNAGKMTFQIRGETTGHSILGYGSYDQSKVKFTKTKLLNGLEITATESKNSTVFTYQLKVTTCDASQ